MNFPAVGFGIGQLGFRRPVGHAGPVDLAVQADADLLEVERGIVLRAGWESNIGAIILAVEVFEPRGPMRCKGIFDTRAGDPAEANVDMLFVVTDSGRIEKTF